MNTAGIRFFFVEAKVAQPVYEHDHAPQTILLLRCRLGTNNVDVDGMFYSIVLESRGGESYYADKSCLCLFYRTKLNHTC